VARVELSVEVGDDLDRIFDHLMRHDVADAPARIGDIMLAIEILERNPLIGRPVDAEMRELVIGRDARGYVARYRYIAQLDTVFVLAIRSQKEAGYS
jgi:plasmid stabilization system protein ParE